MDPQLMSDGTAYGPVRFHEIVQERYLISKKCNTSYIDVGLISPLERQYLIKFILDEVEYQQEQIDKIKNKNDAQRLS